MLIQLSRTGRLVLFSLLTICFAGCTTIPFPKGSSKGYSSVRFIKPNAPLGEDGTPKFIEANRMIKEAIATELEKNGLKVVDGNADLIVSHLIILQDNISTAYCNQYYGLQEYSDIVDFAHKKGMKKHYPEKVQKRALVIDLIDAKTYKLVYRNYALSGPLANFSEEERQAYTTTAVAGTLRQFFR
jgi:phosphoribosylaminoimidazole-succinocarboxamide synthase